MLRFREYCCNGGPPTLTCPSMIDAELRRLNDALQPLYTSKMPLDLPPRRPS
jgi:hypothetical protein